MEIDMLEQIFKKQEDLQKELNAVYNQEYINTMTLAAIDELLEMLRETPWKPWKKNQHFNHDEYKKELADVLHFIVNLCLVENISAKDLYEEYMEKNKINFERKKENY